MAWPLAVLCVCVCVCVQVRPLLISQAARLQLQVSVHVGMRICSVGEGGGYQVGLVLIIVCAPFLQSKASNQEMPEEQTTLTFSLGSIPVSLHNI